MQLEIENKEEDYGIELFKEVKIKESGICTTRGNSKLFSLKLNIIDICCVMIIFVWCVMII